MKLRRAWGTAVIVGIGFACAGGVALADELGLPADGSQINNDPANGIDPHQNAGVSDVVGGSLVAGGPRVPWATFEQTAGGAQRIFVRAFKGGQWVTQGSSLNISPNVEAEAPSIDFAGAGRTVPWDSWYEPNAALGGAKEIFASRFCAVAGPGCTAANTWVPEGQDRGSGAPSLNIHTNKEAENPSVAGGATVAGNAPVPWVAWQEEDGNVAGSGNHDQIFVSKGVKQASLQAPCTGFKPSSANSVSSFCWQQVGLDRLAPNGGSSSTGDPTLNVDPSRNGIEPDIAFTGPNDTVAWVVWYEVDTSALGLRSNDQVFAAKIVTDPSADGGFHWQAVGSGTAGQTNVLDTSHAPPGFGPCAASTKAEDACSLNADATRDAEDPRVAAGTLTPGSATVPWAVWAEDIGGGNHAIFVSRLVGGDHFELFNGGAPVSDRDHDATHPGHHVLRKRAVRVLDRVRPRQAARILRPLRKRRLRRGHARWRGADRAAAPPRGVDRRASPDLLELHSRPVHQRRLRMRGGTGQRAVLHVHDRRQSAEALRPGDHRWAELCAVPWLPCHDLDPARRRGDQQ